MSYLTRRLFTLQQFKNSIDTQEKLRLNLHSLSVSVSELFEYGRISFNHGRTLRGGVGKVHTSPEIVLHLP